jgi:hypothetical protein
MLRAAWVESARSLSEERSSQKGGKRAYLVAAGRTGICAITPAPSAKEASFKFSARWQPTRFIGATRSAGCERRQSSGEAAARGMKVRIWRNPNEAANVGDYDVDAQLGGRVQGLEVRSKAPGGELTHLKGYCIDHRLLRSGWANFSRSCEARRDNDLVTLRARTYAQASRQSSIVLGQGLEQLRCGSIRGPAWRAA